MSSRMCNQCGCTDIDIDSARGDAVCTGCGSVLEDQIIVSEVQFQENSGGGSSMIGQFVSSEGPGKSFSVGGSFPHGMHTESRTITLQNGKRRIQQLASQMNFNQHCIDTAFNFFKMAVSKRITRGRKNTHVIAACLYLVCRTERTSHMLLDFSDALQVNVYSLGRTYLQLARELCINIPDIDPCLYIQRFAHALQFGDKTHEVCMTAMRLTQRMKRDWMATGRRPNGLCGAALLVAARIHDFSRSVKEIVKVVKVCHSTIRKRLVEFEETASSQLTIEEFQNIDLEEEHDPPCYTEGKRRAKKIQEQSKMMEYTSEVSKIQEEIEETLRNQKPKGIWAAYAKMTDDTCSIDSESSRLSDISEAEVSGKITDTTSTLGQSEASISNSSAESPFICQIDDSNSVTSKLREKLIVKTGLNDDNIVETASDNKESLTVKEDNETRVRLCDSVCKETIVSSLVMGGDIDCKDTADGTTGLAFGNTGLEGSSLGLHTADKLGLGVSEIVEKCMIEGSDDSRDGLTEGNDELDLTGIDDKEIDMFLLSEKEVLVKTKLWMRENAEFLEQQRLKEERKAKEAEEEAKKPPEKRRRTFKKKKKQPVQEASTAQEAIQKIMQEKKISCKINYDVLNDLNVQTTSKLLSAPPIAASILMAEKQPMSRIRKTSISFDLRVEEPEVKKKRKEETGPILPFTITAKPTTPDVVVESGPVQYEQKDDVYGEEEDDMYEDEDQHISAAALLGHTGEGEDDYDYDLG